MSSLFRRLFRPSSVADSGPHPDTSQIPERYEQALAHQQNGQFAQAQAILEEVLASQPDHQDALHKLGVLALQTGSFEKADELLTAAIALNPGNAAFHLSLGAARQEIRQLDAAVASYDRAIQIDPNLAEAHFRRGLALQQLNKAASAIASYDRVIEIAPASAVAYLQRGLALRSLGRPADAVASIDRAIEFQPDFVEAHFYRANMLHSLGRTADALPSYQRAIELRPNMAEAYANRGIALLELKRPAEAVECFDRAIDLQVGVAANYYNRGNALKELDKLEAAVDSYDQALAIDPRFGDAHIHRGWALRQLKRYEDAIESFGRALSINPDYPYLFGLRLHIKMSICDWTNLAEEIAELRARIEQDRKAVPAFPALSLMDCLPLQHKVAKTFASDVHPSNSILGEIPKRPRGERIRIGYFSSDFKEHPVALLITELFELHDRSQFELFGFSLGPAADSPTRERIACAFDHFIDVKDKTDIEVAKLARHLKVDIAVDLNGYTINARTGIFALRAAPVQAHYLGYPGTMGVDYIDYVIADRTIIAAEHREHYSEKIVWLPGSYQPNDRKRVLSEKQFTKSELGLPPQGFVFCSFNNSYKITPATFAGWMRILRAVDGSVLWLSSLLEDNPWAKSRLRSEAEKQGVAAERLIFAVRLPMAEHLARQREADLFLDTLPFNAHTTASDALWAGLPVLTQIGDAYPGRVAASLLKAVGLSELVVQTQAEYEALAVELASDHERLNQLKQTLAANRSTASLFNTPLLATQLEAAYTLMLDRYEADLPPDDIDVP